MRVLCVLALLLALRAPAGADAVTLTLKGNKRQISGEIVRLEGDKLFLKTRAIEVGVPVASLTATSCGVVADALFARTPPKQAGGFLDLGDFCLRHKLWARARKSYERARAIDDSYVTQSLARQGIELADRQEARALYQAGVDHHAAGRTAPARTALEELVRRFPASQFAAPARKLLALLAAVARPAKQQPKQAPPPKKKPQQQPKQAPQQKPKLPDNRYLRYLQALLGEIEAHRKAALREEAEGHQQKAIKEYEQALAKLDRAGQLAAKLAAHTDAAVAAAAKQIAADLPRLRTRFYLALGHAHASTDQLRQATRYVNEVLIVDPENKQALALRDRITEERMRRVINVNKSGEGK